jgi:superfamily II DNA/RNA helicase
VDVLVKRYLSAPVVHSVDSAESPVPQMAHHVLTVKAEHKPAVVRELVSGQGRTIAFTRTKHGAVKLTKQLRLQGVAAVDLHGNLTQAARQRNLASFTAGTARVLVATDIAARGIHVDDVALVVHVDPPAEHKAYLHRSGRTARAGAEGVVVTVGLPHERGDVTRLMRQASITPATHTVEPGHDMLRTFSGPPADPVDPERSLVTAPPAQPSRAGRPGGRPRRRRSPGGR